MTYQEYIDKNICPVCKRSAKIVVDDQTRNLQVDCNACGTYKITRELIDDNFVCAESVYDLSKLSSYLYYHKSEENNIFLSQSQNAMQKARISPQTVENWYPKTFAEKIDLILLKMSENSKYDGAPVFVDEDILFITNRSNTAEVGFKRKYYIDFLESHGFVEQLRGTQAYILKPKASMHIYELQKNSSASKDVFVSMAFNDGTKDTREAIRLGVEKAGFSSKFIDEIIHNHQIMPEMFRLIRECRFLILEISDPNYGAYYEAGYALGLGKEVIICCKEEIFNKEYTTDEEKKYAKYLKPHFDIAQKQILVWDDYEDLKKKLSEWIKALF
jgi:nucleoside 2-deoxyribosyltransferase